MLQILDQVEKQVHGPVLTRWPVLIYYRVDGNSLLNAGHVASGLFAIKGFNDGGGAVLPVISAMAPPYDTEYLAETELINDAPALTVRTDQGSEAQNVNARMRN